MIKYPTIDEIILTNQQILKLIRVKKADSHKLLGTRYQIQEIINKSKHKKGNVYTKATVLLKELTTKHLFASGNRRTAYSVATHFIKRNNKNSKNKIISPENLDIFKKIRYGRVSNEDISKWLKK